MPEIFTASSSVTSATGSEHSGQKTLFSRRELLITNTSCFSTDVLVLRVLFIVALVLLNTEDFKTQTEVVGEAPPYPLRQKWVPDVVAYRETRPAPDIPTSSEVGA